jgi:hypothetical protein
MRLALDCYTIEPDPDTSITTVVGTRSYSLPTRYIAIKRMTYDGQKMKKTNFKEDDMLTYYDEDTSSTGEPLYYQQYGDKVYLRPVPDDTKTLKIYGYKEPAVITVSGTIETPTRYHATLINGVVAEMAHKDENHTRADRYDRKFEQGVIMARAWQKKRRRGDSFASVVSEESMDDTVLGAF